VPTQQPLLALAHVLVVAAQLRPQYAGICVQAQTRPPVAASFQDANTAPAHLVAVRSVGVSLLDAADPPLRIPDATSPRILGKDRQVITRNDRDNCMIGCNVNSNATTKDENSCSSSLNTDPYNLRSEELALAECCRGMEIRRVWSEIEMVRSFGGNIFPGTPDGMFECWDGTLTCVQVVRVPLVSGMNSAQMQDALVYTVLTKVVKSQHWLRATNVVPCDFIIFCWLPFTVPREVAQLTECLMDRVQVLDPRFSLRLRVPAEAGALFPALFAYTNPCRKSQSSSRCRTISESEVTAFTSLDDCSDDEALFDFDITWEWDLDLGESATGLSSGVEETTSCEPESTTDQVRLLGYDDGG